MDKKSKAVIKLMEKLSDGEKSAKEIGWIPNNEIISAMLQGEKNY